VAGAVRLYVHVHVRVAARRIADDLHTGKVRRVLRGIEAGPLHLLAGVLVLRVYLIPDIQPALWPGVVKEESA
jgi:hypothetical protein